MQGAGDYCDSKAGGTTRINKHASLPCLTPRIGFDTQEGISLFSNNIKYDNIISHNNYLYTANMLLKNNIFFKEKF